MVAAAALLRLAVVPRQALWADELFSLGMATGHSLEQPAAEADPGRGDYVESALPEPASHYARYLGHDRPPAGLGRVVRAVALSDTSPPLYYVLLWAWTRVLGTGDVAVRLLSVVASLAALLLVAAAARGAAGRAAALPAAALFAVSPIGVLYSTEARMYALLLVWSAAAPLLALRLRARGGRPVLLLLYALVGAGGLLTHYFFLPVFAGVSLWLLARPGRCDRGRLLASLAAVAALVAPWYAALPSTLARWRVTGNWLKLVPQDFDPFWSRLRLPWSLLSVRAAEGVPATVDWIDGIALISLLAVALSKRGRRLASGPRAALWIAALAGLATPLLADAALGTYASMHPRYALAGLPAATAVVAVLVATLRSRRRAFVMALLLTLGLAGSFRVQRASSRATEPFAALGSWLVRQADAGDVAIVHSIPSVVCGVGRYMVRAGAGPGSVPIASWVGPLGRRRAPRDIEALASGRRRVLLVRIHTVADSMPEESWLRAHARLAGEQWLEKASVLAFVPRQGKAFPVRSAAGGGREPVRGR